MDWTQTIGTITPPAVVAQLGNGEQGIAEFISILLNVAFTIAGLVLLFMLVQASFQWLTSGGEKEPLAKARARMTNALIGIALLALSILIVNVILTILGLQTIG